MAESPGLREEDVQALLAAAGQHSSEDRSGEDIEPSVAQAAIKAVEALLEEQANANAMAEEEEEEEEEIEEVEQVVLYPPIEEPTVIEPPAIEVTPAEGQVSRKRSAEPEETNDEPEAKRQKTPTIEEIIREKIEPSEQVPTEENVPTEVNVPAEENASTSTETAPAPLEPTTETIATSTSTDNNEHPTCAPEATKDSSISSAPIVRPSTPDNQPSLNPPPILPPILAAAQAPPISSSSTNNNVLPMTTNLAPELIPQISNFTSINVNEMPKDQSEAMLWIAQQIKDISDRNSNNDNHTDEGDTSKTVDREKVREENRERKKRWRESNQSRNKDNDLRCRVMKRATKLFGREDSPKKADWVQKEFTKRRNKREAKEQARRYDHNGNAIFSLNDSASPEASRQLGNPLSGIEAAAESVREMLGTTEDSSVFTEVLDLMTGNEEFMEAIAQLLTPNISEEDQAALLAIIVQQLQILGVGDDEESSPIEKTLPAIQAALTATEDTTAPTEIIPAAAPKETTNDVNTETVAEETTSEDVEMATSKDTGSEVAVGAGASESDEADIQAMLQAATAALNEDSLEGLDLSNYAALQESLQALAQANGVLPEEQSDEIPEPPMEGEEKMDTSEDVQQLEIEATAEAQTETVVESEDHEMTEANNEPSEIHQEGLETQDLEMSDVADFDLSNLDPEELANLSEEELKALLSVIGQTIKDHTGDDEDHDEQAEGAEVLEMAAEPEGETKVEPSDAITESSNTAANIATAFIQALLQHTTNTPPAPPTPTNNAPALNPSHATACTTSVFPADPARTLKRNRPSVPQTSTPQPPQAPLPLPQQQSTPNPQTPTPANHAPAPPAPPPPPPSLPPAPPVTTDNTNQAKQSAYTYSIPPLMNFNSDAAAKLLKPPAYIPKSTAPPPRRTTVSGIRSAIYSKDVSMMSERERKVKSMGFPPMMAGIQMGKS